MEASRTAPLATVTIPTYNRAGLLSRSIESVLDQSLKEVEVYVSDNASTDRTAAVVASFRDPRVHYVRNESNLGHLVNLSRGLGLGTAPFLTVLPDDDVMLPGNLERKVSLLQSDSRVDLAHSASRLVHVGSQNDVLSTDISYTGGFSDWVLPGSEVLRRLLTDHTWINFPAAVMRRSVIGDARFDQADGLADDLGLFLRLMRRVDMVAYIAEPLVELRMHAGAVSSSHGFHALEGAAYSPTFVAVANIRGACERFLAEFGHELPDGRELRASSRRWTRSLLVAIAASRSAARESRVARCAVLIDAARVDPTLPFSPEGLRFLGRSIVGPKGRRFVRRVQGWIAT